QGIDVAVAAALVAHAHEAVDAVGVGLAIAQAEAPGPGEAGVGAGVAGATAGAGFGAGAVLGADPQLVLLVQSERHAAGAGAAVAGVGAVAGRAGDLLAAVGVAARGGVAAGEGREREEEDGVEGAAGRTHRRGSCDRVYHARGLGR